MFNYDEMFVALHGYDTLYILRPSNIKVMLGLGLGFNLSLYIEMLPLEGEMFTKENS